MATFEPITAPPIALSTAAPTISTLPPLFQNSSTPLQILTQGAEALLYQTTYLTPQTPCALKYRPSKPYRHPTLDARLTKHRILSEARVLVRCRREGVPVPAVYALDEGQGWICMEWIEGGVVRVRINAFMDRGKVEGGIDGGKGEEELRGLMERCGRAVGRMHAIGIIHGDLTTSNLMLRDTSPAVNGDTFGDMNRNTNGDATNGLNGEVVLIDFGLASQSEADEDRAVDLYVLERAFGSTHPRAERFFADLLRAYGESFKGAKVVLKRLEDVRMRGRKKSMLG